MSHYGKHAKSIEPTRVGKHGIAVQPRYPIWQVALGITLAASIAFVPITFASSHVILDSQAFADSARSAFPTLSDAQPQEAYAAMPTSQANYTAHVKAKMQNGIMSGGCEIVSLGIVLDSMGVDADLHLLVNDFLNVNGHFNGGYSGDPYSQGAGYPHGIASAANGYLESIGAETQAHNLTGAPFSSIKSLVNSGYPVLVWTTMDFNDPVFTGIYDEGAEWYENEHCVVVYGFDGGKVLISDPLEGLIERDSKQFADIYEQCGSMAIALF